jgi:sulfur carrier protein
MKGTDMSDNVGHDGPSEADDVGSVVISINGRRIWIGANTTVAVLLESLGYPTRGVAVALNRAVLPRSSWQTRLYDGARLEVLAAVQGG